MLGATDTEVSGIAGARAVIGTGSLGNVGLTYYQAAASTGRTEIYGADISTTIGTVGVEAEAAQSEPTDALSTAAQVGNQAWNAKLNWQSGNLGVAAGYSTVRTNYHAPGYWSDIGRAVNLVNVEGPMANLTYALSPRISLSAEGQFLEPKDNAFAVEGRTSLTQGRTVSVAAGLLDKITAWKAGIKYSLTAANSIDLGLEQVSWEPKAGKDTEETYISIGLGHAFNPNASLKLLYQIVEYDQGGLSPYAASTADYRGGVATAQFQLKY